MQASVPSPVVNVLCAELTLDEIRPMVYTEWEGFKHNSTMPNATTWPDGFNLTFSPHNNTKVDDLFEFDDVQRHPVFPKLPQPYNTVFNVTKVFGPRAAYLLANSTTGNYTLCSIRAALTPNCSTEYNSTGSGGSLSIDCNSKNHRNYGHFTPPNSSLHDGIWSQDYQTVISEWGTALSLNDGISDGKSSNARLLTQLIPSSEKLDPSLPSISEALAVLASCTLLLSSLDSPFTHYWNYSDTVNTLKQPQYQSFHGRLKTKAYQSGGNKAWQQMFHVVLFLVFVFNVCCLLYLLASGQLVTDFVEPQNTFCLSLLSPPSEALEGSCAGGPDKEHYGTKWNIKLDKTRDHVWFEGKRDRKGIIHNHRPNWSGSTHQNEYEMQASPMARMYSRLRKKRSSML